MNPSGNQRISELIDGRIIRLVKCCTVLLSRDHGSDCWRISTGLGPELTRVLTQILERVTRLTPYIGVKTLADAVELGLLDFYQASKKTATATEYMINEQAFRLHEKEASFRSELRELINRHSFDNRTNTPDFVLAQFLSNCLFAFDAAVMERDLHKLPASLLTLPADKC